MDRTYKSEKEAFASVINKMEMAYASQRCVQETRSSDTTARSFDEALYATDCLAMNKKGLIEKLEGRKRFWGNSGSDQRQLRIREDCTHMLTTQRTQLGGRGLSSMVTWQIWAQRSTNRIFAYYLSKQATEDWFTQVESDLQEVEITQVNLCWHKSIYSKT